jgi:1-acyl-sn-glycerol-3-phosphate acyltransferase
MVQSGCRIQVFPEGTRTRDGQLSETVYLRTARDAHARGLPVVPCGVMDTEQALPVPMVGAYPLTTPRLHIGEALRPSDYPDADRFAVACWDAVVRIVGGLERG